MCLPISMPVVPSFEPQPFSGTIWRMAEIQHQASVMKLVDTIEEQALLERLLEETKPALPRECAGLDPLLSAPFRYGAPDPGGSRFRRAGRTLGIFYGAETVEAALADMVIQRLKLFAEAPATASSTMPGDFIAFAVPVSTMRAIDLGAERFEEGEVAGDAACQSLADDAREAGVEAIVYPSPLFRLPSVKATGRSLALLSPKVFASSEPVERQRWRIRISATTVSALCDMPARRFGFSLSDLIDDRDGNWG
ncbi:RES domain protein [Rhizobium sp. PDO1-076]|nr:RES domain protein [Rhizobium sp. PDO1-076]